MLFKFAVFNLNLINLQVEYNLTNFLDWNRLMTLNGYAKNISHSINNKPSANYKRKLPHTSKQLGSQKFGIRQINEITAPLVLIKFNDIAIC